MQLPVFGGPASRRLARLLAKRPDRRQRARHLSDVGDLNSMVALTGSLEDLDLTPRPEFKAELRERLIAMAERDGIGATAKHPGDDDDPTNQLPLDIPRRRPAASRRPTVRARAHLRTVVVAAAAAIAGIAVASFIASSRAVPGDTLYVVKTSSEDAQLALAGDPVAKGELYLEFARTRLAEAEADSGDPVDLPDLFMRMDDQTRQGVALLAAAAAGHHDPAPLDQIARFSVDQQRLMPDVLADIRGAAYGRAVISQTLLGTIDNRVTALRSYIHCADPRPVRTDDLGPVPHECGRDSGDTTPANPGASDTTPPRVPADPPTNEPDVSPTASPADTPDPDPSTQAGNVPPTLPAPGVSLTLTPSPHDSGGHGKDHGGGGHKRKRPKNSTDDTPTPVVSVAAAVDVDVQLSLAA